MKIAAIVATRPEGRQVGRRARSGPGCKQSVYVVTCDSQRAQALPARQAIVFPARLPVGLHDVVAHEVAEHEDDEDFDPRHGATLPRLSLLAPGSSCLSDGDGLLAAEVGDGDLAALDVGERAVAAVGDGPVGSADGGGAVAAAGAEAAFRVSAQAPDLATRLGRGLCAGGARLALAALKLEPFSRISVSPLRLAFADWIAWNTPPLKSPSGFRYRRRRRSGAPCHGACRAASRPGSAAPRRERRTSVPPGAGGRDLALHPAR